MILQMEYQAARIMPSYSRASQASSMAVFLPSFVLILLSGLHCESAHDRNSTSTFSFSLDDGFEKNSSFVSEVALYDHAEINSGSVVVSSSGRIMNRNPIRFFGPRPGFSTDFAFSLSSPGKSNYGGLAFFLVPTTSRNSHLDSPASAKGEDLMKGKFIVTRMVQNTSGSSGSFVEIHVGDQVLIRSKNISTTLHSALTSGDKLHAWIDYNGDSKRIEVRLSKSKEPKPLNATISYQIDLSNILWREAMLVGISSSGRNSTQACKIYSWSFSVTQGAPYLMHSEPLDPDAFLLRPYKSPPAHERRSFSWGFLMAMLFAAACGALLTFFTMFGWFALVLRRPVAPVEYPVHPVDVVYEKIVWVGNKGLHHAQR